MTGRVSYSACCGPGILPVSTPGQPADVQPRFVSKAGTGTPTAGRVEVRAAIPKWHSSPRPPSLFGNFPHHEPGSTRRVIDCVRVVPVPAVNAVRSEDLTWGRRVGVDQLLADSVPSTVSRTV